METVGKLEAKLLKRAGKGDRQAFREIVEAHKKKIFYFAYDLTGSMEDAEDLSQEVFLKAFRHIAKFRGEASLGSWLYRITLNTFLDQKRKVSYNEEKQQLALDNQAVDHGAIDEDNPFQAPDSYAESRQIRDHVDRALQRLSPRERSVFVLRHYQGLPVKEVAGLLGISGGTVKSLLFRALHKLQQELHFYKDFKGVSTAEVIQ